MAPLIQDGIGATGVTSMQSAYHNSPSQFHIHSDGEIREKISDHRSEATEHPAHGTLEDAMEPIAIVGMSAKLPQSATSPEAFWKLLEEGRSAMTEVPSDRFNIDAFYHPNGDRLNTLNVRGGHFLQSDLAEFDAPFFSIPKTEAESLDPQQRGLLESTYHALENAGIPLKEAGGSKTGVFVGCFAKEYDTIFSRDTDLQPKYQASGTGSAMLANRLSWFYDLRGPSITLDTACSSSLNALHLACQSIRAKESTMAIVAGCNVILNPDTIMMSLSNLQFLSPDSLCYSFDHRANGYSRGEGFGVIVLKPLSQALSNNDTIRAVIRASSSNQDGRTPGITQPSGDAQALLIQETYEKAGLDLGTTRFFEAHGTGTQIGDTTEAAAIHSVFGKYRSPEEPLIVGAVKSNIGHLEGASGLASIIKTVLALEKGVIPPNTNFEKPNPRIPFPTENIPWPSKGLRRASVNSFGYGGANAHVILDDAYHYLKVRGLQGRHRTAVPRDPRTQSARSLIRHWSAYPQPKLLVWSAADEQGPQRYVEALKAHLSETKGADHAYIVDLAYTLASKRSRLPWKSFLRLDSTTLSSTDLWRQCSKPVRSSGNAPGLAFVFTGQGATWYGMGRELLAEPVFQESLQQSDAYLRKLGSKWSLIGELQQDETCSRVKDARYSQPLTTAIQIALLRLLESWNIRPLAVVGHSSGEIAAAYCIGAISHRHAIAAAYYRGTLSAELAAALTDTPETMMAVALSPEETSKHIHMTQSYGSVCISCVNSPKNVTVSGSVSAIEAMRSNLDTEGVFARRLDIKVAYHSPTMQRLALSYLELLQSLDTHDPETPKDTGVVMFSSVTGTLISHKDVRRAEYWVENMVSRVEFSSALSAMHKYVSATDCIVELGPTGALRRSVLETLGKVLYESALKVDRPAYETILGLVGDLWSRGVPVDLMAVNGLTESNAQMLTDLPSYPFNHSHRYWYESRISKNFRFRKHASHELLGTQAMDWNPLEAKWRHIIDAKENPWIKDHGFNGSQIYPAAGMVIMAIEAARQVTKSDGRTITGFRIKNVSFVKALVLSDKDETLETHFYLRPQEAARDTFGEWFDFRLCSLSNEEGWVENCRGTIIIETEEEVVEVDEGLEAAEMRHSILQSHARTLSSCKSGVSSKQMYENLATFGFEFGPTFQTLKNIGFSEQGYASACIDTREWQTKVPSIASKIQSHLIHPTALDAVFHLTVTAISRGGWKPIPTMVPTYLHELWISSKLLHDPDASSLQICSESLSRGLRDADFNMTAVDDRSGDLVITASQYRATAISSVDMNAPGVSSWRRLCFKPEWKMDIATADNDAVSRYCNSAADSVDVHSQASVDDAELVCIYFMRQTLEAGCTRHVSQPHLQKYVDWIRHYLQEDCAQAVSSSEKMQRMLNDQSYADSVILQLEASGPEGKVYVTIGKMLSAVLQDEVGVLELLFGDGLLQQFYSGKAFTANYERMRAYVDLMAHKNPNMSVLEIGAGTGGATAAVLQALGPSNPSDENSTPRFQEYAYTDISAGFFEEAKIRFKDHTSRLAFKTLDIEKETQAQGFEEAKYDLIVASCVLHATADIQQTLQHTQSLLKPGGKLLLFEPCQLSCARLSFVFGLLPGWWLSKEQHRRWGPLLRDEQWDESLRSCGFSGNDLCLRDQEGPQHTFSVMVSSKTVPSAVNGASARISIIVVDTHSQMQMMVAESLQASAHTMAGLDCTVMSLQDIATSSMESYFCISLLELETPCLWQIGSEGYASLQHLVKNFRCVLWVTGDPTQDPRMGVATGFARSMCSENDALDFISLALRNLSRKEDVVSTILKVVQSSLRSPDGQCEQEYQEDDGLLHINRIIESNDVNNVVHKQAVPQKAELHLFGTDRTRPLSLNTASPGLLSALQFVDSPFKSELEADEIEVAVKAVGINFKDVMIALGQIPDASLGQECSGVVTAVGAAVHDSEFRVGDRVCCVTRGAFRNLARAHRFAISKIPDEMSFATAAAIPVAFCTAWYSLVHLGRLQAGETILIHAAAGGVGQAAIQLAKAASAEIYVTVSSNEKKRLLMELYGIPADHIFSSRHISFAQGLKRMTKGRGVDVVLNSLSGEFLKASVDCVAPLGRFVEIGKKDMYFRSQMSMSPFLQGISFLAVDLGVIADRAKPLMKELLNRVMGYFTKQKNTMQPPQPLTVFSGSQLEEAFRSLQSGRNSGKAVIAFSPEDLVPIVPTSRPGWSFASDATYVIAGGSGGLGRSMARYMATHGAKHILLLSRSGSDSPQVSELIRELQQDGVTVVAPSCDVSDAHALETVIHDLHDQMPPIQGCIQGSMVLRDGLFENMSHDNFLAALRPKIQGTWNLHNSLPSGMDFFVLLSSTGGVFGSRGQSNYAAGSTYQDAFAKYRVSLGEKCISLDLGLMLAVGFAAERQHITDSLRTVGYEGIHEIEFHAMLDRFCNPDLPLQDPTKAQIVTGVATPASLAAKGLGEIFWMSKPIFQSLRQMDRQFSVSRTVREEGANYRAQIEQAMSQQGAGHIIALALVRKLSAALNMPIADIEVEKPVYAYGVDSLVAVEIRYWFLKEFKAQIAVFEIIRSESIEKLCLLVASKTQYQQRWN
ncbi:Fatty acid synthase S-acetyltransferase [Pyrenophora tritici-repentis]|nr:Fatty acid synthase S-acetyltransferase [Pyrenophora tritici-repentis]